MATERQANKARELHAEHLIHEGAHAVGVDKGSRYGKRGFVVVAYVEPQQASRIPDSLKCRSGKKAFKVAVVTKPSERFAPEGPDRGE